MHDESDILQLIARGDEGALRIIFDDYYKAMCVYALRYLADIADAEDVVQDVLTSFWINKKGKTFTGSVRAYLFGAVAKASCKRVSRNMTVPFGDVEAYVDDQFAFLAGQSDQEREMVRRRLDAGIAQLPPRSREVFIAVAQHNLSYKEAGARLGISANTVKTLYYIAVKKLREKIGDNDLLILMLLLAFRD